MSAIASSSRVRIASAAPRLVRSYAAAPGNPHNIAPSDQRSDVLRAALYPADSVAPTSAAPVGARHPAHAARIKAVLPSEEAHETVERAFALFRRRAREQRESALKAKYDAMVDACDELAALADSRKITKAVYDRAMVRMSHASAAHTAAEQGAAQGKKKTPESRFLEHRVEGLVPRELWVPTETRGKGWNYEWTRPLNE